MFAVLSAGVALWVVYGLMRSDFVIITANAVSFCLLAAIIWFKLREKGNEASHTATL